jgi:hypothetical protein
MIAARSLDAACATAAQTVNTQSAAMDVMRRMASSLQVRECEASIRQHRLL